MPQRVLINGARNQLKLLIWIIIRGTLCWRFRAPSAFFAALFAAKDLFWYSYFTRHAKARFKGWRKLTVKIVSSKSRMNGMPWFGWRALVVSIQNRGSNQSSGLYLDWLRWFELLIANQAIRKKLVKFCFLSCFCMGPQFRDFLSN